MAIRFNALDNQWLVMLNGRWEVLSRKPIVNGLVRLFTSEGGLYLDRKEIQAIKVNSEGRLVFVVDGIQYTTQEGMHELLLNYEIKEHVLCEADDLEDY